MAAAQGPCLRTFTTVQISELLESFNISASPQELKNINTDLLQKIYLAMLYELDYEAEHFEMLGNFEAISQLERKEDYEDILPLAHFCLMLNKVFEGFSNMEVSNYDLFSPKWKDQRFLVSVILNYCLYARDLKAIYQAVCNEFVDACVHKKELQEEVSNLLKNINKLKSLISHKKNDEKICEVLNDVIAEMDQAAVLKEQRKANWAEMKSKLGKAKLEQDEMQKELELIEQENTELAKAIIDNPEKYENEIDEIKEKISIVKLQINHKKVEDAEIENKYIVTAAKNAPLSFTSTMPKTIDQFNLLQTEVTSVRGHYETQKSHIATRIATENTIKDQTKTHARLKEEKVAFSTSMEKQRMQIVEAIKDKQAELEELQKAASRKLSQNRVQITTRKNLSTNKETETLRLFKEYEAKTKKLIAQDQMLQDKSQEFKEKEVLKMEQLRKAVEEEKKHLYNMMNKYCNN